MEPSAVLQVGDLALTAHAWKATEDGPDGPVELAGTTVVVRRQADGTWRFVIDDPYGGETNRGCAVLHRHEGARPRRSVLSFWVSIRCGTAMPFWARRGGFDDEIRLRRSGAS